MQDFKEMLKDKGFRATPGRVALLQALWREEEPLTVAQIQKRLSKKLDTVTLYRALEALAAAGVIRRVDLMHGHAHYELEKKHHHHLVCTNCSMIEDVDICSIEELEQKVLKSSPRFASLSTHDLEFFGLCSDCLPRVKSRGAK
jgi:Fur family ferric uptake transcriptional regulator